MDDKKKIVPLFVTYPMSFNGGRAKDSNIGIQTAEDVKSLKDWVDFNEK